MPYKQIIKLLEKDGLVDLISEGFRNEISGGRRMKNSQRMILWL